MELSHSPRTQVTNNTPKPWPTSFFSLWKLKDSQLSLKALAMQVVYLEEESAGRDKDKGNDDSNGMEGVIEEFMVCRARAVKDTQAEEKHCYHCSSPEHFIHNCPLMKTLKEKPQLNGKEGMPSKKGAWTSLTTATMPKNLQTEVPKA